MTTQPRKPCCMPAGPQPLAAAPQPEARATPDAGTATPPMIRLPGGRFLMGTVDGDGFPEDGEGPPRQVTVSPFAIGTTTVTNRQFAAFVRATRYVTESERLGSSYVFWLQAPPTLRNAVRSVPAGLPWWLPIEHACWQRPEGPGSHVHTRPDHPVVHVSWTDAMAYCAWAGCRLPTEAEWEYAARGGLHAARYAWGDVLEPGGRPACNIWQGSFPGTPADGWSPGTMAADAFAPNGFGLYNVAGNVWEWCADWFSPGYHQDTPDTDPRWQEPTGRRSMRGGSYLCHASYCNRYRVGARGSNTPTSASSNCGFRVAAG